MAEGHSPVPIRVEHVETPLNIGVLERIWRAGKDLVGRLLFTPAAWELIRESGARGLSVAIKRDKSGLAEVSLVRAPRIPDAVLFGGETVEFETQIDEGGEDIVETKAAEGHPEPVEGRPEAEFSDRTRELERRLKLAEVDARIAELVRAGKLAPAAKEFARVLLSAGDAQLITFADGSEKPVRETFLAFLEAQPKVIEFSELAHAAQAVGGIIPPTTETDLEHEVLQKLGVTAEAVARYRER